MMKRLACVVLLSFVMWWNPSFVQADVTQPEEGYSALKVLLFIPAAIVQLVAFDIPHAVGSMFTPGHGIDKNERRLKSRNWKDRYQAVSELSGKNAYPLLVKHLTDNQVIVALRAADQLSHANKKDVVPLLVNNLDSRDPWTRKLTLDVLAYANAPQATQDIVFAVQDDDSAVRLSALLALENISGEPLLFDYFPQGATTRPKENILDWWYMRGKIIKKIYETEN